MRIRKASSEDANTLARIAHDAKRYWGYPENWIKHWDDDLTISPEFVANNQVYVAEGEGEGELLGFYALIVRKDKAELDHMWVAPEHIGTGVGKDLFIHAMQSAAKQNVSEVGISSDPNAEGFYKKMGAFQIGEVSSETPDKEVGNPRMSPRLKVDLNSLS